MDRRLPPDAQARAAARLTADFLLRSLRELIAFADGELITAIVAMATSQANVGHLHHSGWPGQEEGAIPPDESRRPVSILALSQGLGLPYETTRRHVEKLVKAGYCVRAKGGVVAPASVFDTAPYRDLSAANLANLRGLYRGLRNAGVDLD